MSREIKSVWGYARTARYRVTQDIERKCLPTKCYICQKRFIHQPDRKAPHEWHHKNGNPFDNRKRNLVALCPHCHNEIHGMALQEHLLVAWSKLGMHIGRDGMTYVTKSGSIFFKRPTDRLHCERPRRFFRLADALKRWARELVSASNFTRTEREQYRDHILMRDLREAIRSATASEKVIMRRLLLNLR